MSTPPGRVVVVGSVNVDLVMRLPRLPSAGETVLGGALARHDGGKGANQAVAAARAGAPVHFVGAVGAQDGASAVAALRAEGVDVTHVLRVAEQPTGHAVVLVAESTGENQIAVASGANAALPAAHVKAALARLAPTPADVVVLSFESPVAPLEAAAEAARAAGAALVVNPAPVQADHTHLLSGAITTPNQHELAALAAQAGVETGQDIQAAAAALARRTEAPVVVTMGASGVLLATGQSSERVPAHGVEAVDTTGAGDTLTGVLAASLAQGYPLRACVLRAVAAAALAVTKPGARTGMPTSAAIDDLLTRTEP